MLFTKTMPQALNVIRQRLSFHCSAVSYAKATKKSKMVAPAIAATSPTDADGENEAKAEALQRVMDSLNKKYGRNTVAPASEFGKHDGETLKTGVLTLDIVLGVGWPKGRVIEVYGPESSGKTTLCLTAIAQHLKSFPDKKALLIDAEHALDLRFCRKLGIDDKRLLVVKPEFGEQALDSMMQLIKSKTVQLVVCDSVAALIPQSELEAEFGTPTMGLHARLMSSSLKRIVAAAEKVGCTVIFTNQIRMKIGVLFGNPETTTGGRALDFYASVRVDLRKTKKITGAKKGDDDLGVKVRAKIVKSKTSAPFRETEFDILWDRGVDQVGCVFDAALKLGVITARGSHYYHGEEKLGQGRDTVLEMLRSNDAKLGELESQVTRSITEDTDASVLIQTDKSSYEFDEDGNPIEAPEDNEDPPDSLAA